MAISSLLGWPREDRIDKRLVLEAEGQIAACRRLERKSRIPWQTSAGKPDGTWGSILDFRSADGAGYSRCGASPPSHSMGRFKVRDGNPDP